MSDRTVHASYDGMEIVRYDRSGKWYLEPTNRTLPRQQVKIGVAVQSALWGRENANGGWMKGLPGGNRFEALLDKALRSKAAEKA